MRSDSRILDPKPDENLVGANGNAVSDLVEIVAGRLDARHGEVGVGPTVGREIRGGFHRVGKKLWHTGAEPMFGRGSMILADGKLLIRDSYHGKLYMVKPTPQGYRQLAVANPFDHKRKDLKRWAPLAISEGLLVIRDEREIKCLDLRKR